MSRQAEIEIRQRAEDMLQDSSPCQPMHTDDHHATRSTTKDLISPTDHRPGGSQPLEKNKVVDLGASLDARALAAATGVHVARLTTVPFGLSTQFAADVTRVLDGAPRPISLLQTSHSPLDLPTERFVTSPLVVSSCYPDSVFGE